MTLNIFQCFEIADHIGASDREAAHWENLSDVYKFLKKRKMTAEEKAKELIEKFLPHSEGHLIEYLGLGETRWQNSGDKQIRNAKQCAIIHVTEMIKELRKNEVNGIVIMGWTEVKSELEKS
jgi:MoxR-like ATPase